MKHAIAGPAPRKSKVARRGYRQPIPPFTLNKRKAVQQEQAIAPPLIPGIKDVTEGLVESWAAAAAADSVQHDTEWARTIGLLGGFHPKGTLTNAADPKASHRALKEVVAAARTNVTHRDQTPLSGTDSKKQGRNVKQRNKKGKQP